MKKEKDPVLEAKKFGKVMFWALLIFGAFFIWRGKPWGQGVAIAAFVFLFFSFILPQFLIPIQKAWMKIGHGLGWVNTRILLGIMFFLVMTPIRFLLWVLGKDLLEQKIDRSRSSYWNARNSETMNPKQYERLY